MRPDDQRHGTYAGAQAHQQAGETPCTPCLDARRAYMRHLRSTNADLRDRESRANRARGRAAWQLTQRHPEEFHTLYLAALREDM